MRKLPEFYTSQVYEPYEHCWNCKDRPPERRGCIRCKETRRRDERAAKQAEEDAARLEDSRLLTAHFDNPDEMQTLKDVFHFDRLKEHFDGSDITDEDVLKPMFARALLDMEVENYERRQTQFYTESDPAQWKHPPLTREEIRRKFLDAKRHEMAAARGAERIREALRGKPGAGPGAESGEAQEAPDGT